MKEKICSKCKITKTVDYFTKHKGRKDGLCNWCIDCNKIYRKKHYEENKDKILKKQSEERKENKEIYKEKDKERYLKNHTKNKQHSLNYYHQNREERIQKNREYKEKNSEVLKQKKKEYDKKYRKIRIQKRKERLKIDVQYKLRQNLRSRISKAINCKNAYKYYKSQDLIGCTIEELKHYLESLFKEGMTWENYGFKGWHVDHIIPCFMFDLTIPEQQKECFHFSNLRPLWWYENVSRNYKELKNS